VEQLEGRVVVITGGASGIGRGMAEAFAEAGARLVLADIHQARLDETAHSLGKGSDVLTLRVDVRDPEQIEALAKRAYAAFGAVHVLCNNAGVACRGLLWEHSVDDWEWVFETNVRATVHGLGTFVPRLLAQDEPAHIVNTSSMLGLSSAPLTGLYGASKQAVLAISEALRFDLALVGAEIGVSVLCPGPVRTNVAEEPGRPPVDAAPLPDVVAQVSASLNAVVANGMDPRKVGDCVVEAVREGRFWILPAPEYLTNAEQRLAEIRSVIDA
jgi:NAD(P)-dependent dehydrogenase (short-subunit alcohol dehydrogenase family)